MFTSTKGRLLPAIGLIVGSGLGVGFIQLASIRSAGFGNDFLVSLLSMFFTMGSGLLWAEATIAATFSSCKDANFATISRKYLGKVGIVVCYFVFLAITTTYLINNLGIPISMIYSLFLEKLHLSLPSMLIGVVFFLIFASLLFLGLRVANRINFVLVIGFLCTFTIITILKFDTYSLAELKKGEWFFLIFLAPILTTSYVFQFIIPTCCHYLNNDVRKIKYAITIGVFVMFIFLVFWQMFLIVVIPDEALLGTFEHKMPTFHGLQHLSTLKNIRFWIFITLIFSAVTSVITVSISLLDFFLDLWFQKRNADFNQRAWLTILIFLPTTLIATFYLSQYTVYSRLLLSWLELIFIGALPAWIVINIRYQKKLPTPQLLPGGATTLIIFFFIALIHCYFQGANLIWTP